MSAMSDIDLMLTEYEEARKRVSDVNDAVRAADVLVGVLRAKIGGNR